MTLQPTSPEPVEPPPVLVDVSEAPETDRLVALYRARPQAKADADAAAAVLKAINDGIKVELTTRTTEGTAKVELRGEGGTPLRLAWQITRRFNSKRFDKDHPGVYDSYKEPSGSWVLAEIKGGE